MDVELAAAASAAGAHFRPNKPTARLELDAVRPKLNQLEGSRSLAHQMASTDLPAQAAFELRESNRVESGALGSHIRIRAEPLECVASESLVRQARRVARPKSVPLPVAPTRTLQVQARKPSKQTTRPSNTRPATELVGPQESARQKPVEFERQAGQPANFVDQTTAQPEVAATSRQSRRLLFPPIAFRRARTGRPPASNPKLDRQPSPIRKVSSEHNSRWRSERLHDACDIYARCI